MQFVGLKNYAKMIQDPLVRKSLMNTLLLRCVRHPARHVRGAPSLLLNQKLKGMRHSSARSSTCHRSLRGVATFLLWSFIFNPEMGLMNRALSHKVPWIEFVNGIAIKYIPFIAQPPKWLADPHWAMPALIIMSLWGVGGGMLIYLAGLQGIPEELYEAALLDGAGNVQKFLVRHHPDAESDDFLQPDHVHHRLVPGVRRSVRHDRRRTGELDSVLCTISLPERNDVLPDGIRVGDGMAALHHHTDA